MIMHSNDYGTESNFNYINIYLYTNAKMVSIIMGVLRLTNFVRDPSCIWQCCFVFL